jgi:lipopolysaccharide export system permease protein
MSKRFVFAMASICFVLIGMPLGIRAQRKESTIGMTISLGVALGYYLIIMLMLSLQKSYSIYPEILIWIPVAACFALTVFFTRKNL